MSYTKMLLMVFVMALVTYAIRMIPLTFFRKKIKSKYVKSVLFYMPYCVLSAMTFPFIFYATGNIYTALAGTFVSITLALLKKPLLTVAICSVVACLVVGLIIL